MSHFPLLVTVGDFTETNNACLHMHHTFEDSAEGTGMNFALINPDTSSVLTLPFDKTGHWK